MQLYTAFIYEGPFLLRRVHAGSLERVRGGGLESMRDAACGHVTDALNRSTAQARGSTSNGNLH